MKATWNEIVAVTRRFVHQAGFTKVVVGLSGGIDSAVVTCAACEALGSQNVLAVMMPSPHSSPGSITDSIQLAHSWGCETITIPIEPMMTAFDVALQPSFGARKPNVTDQNIQARIRMVLLMAFCNEYGCLLLNTGNRSEALTGYCTVYGDTAGALAPIGDLYKTEVYRLARWINEQPDLPCIPVAIIEKEPSAELAPGQLDSNDLPPYDQLDAILRLWLRDEPSIQEFEEMGFHPVRVQQIIRLVNGSAFKRQQSAPVLKLEGVDR